MFQTFFGHHLACTVPNSIISIMLKYVSDQTSENCCRAIETDLATLLDLSQSVETDLADLRQV